jgi:hypothetical protein
MGGGAKRNKTRARQDKARQDKTRQDKTTACTITRHFPVATRYSPIYVFHEESHEDKLDVTAGLSSCSLHMPNATHRAVSKDKDKRQTTKDK